MLFNDINALKRFALKRCQAEGEWNLAKYGKYVMPIPLDISVNHNDLDAIAALTGCIKRVSRQDSNGCALSYEVTWAGIRFWAPNAYYMK